MNKKSILLISNGHGEDIIAANLLKELFKINNEIKVKVLPIVGVGKAYESLPVDIIGPLKSLPSGGFMRNSLSNFLGDIKAGLLGITIEQIKAISKVKDEVDLVIPVGDVFILILAGLFTNKKIVFIPTAKSEYISGHYWIEKFLMKKMVEIVLPRDKKTAQVLQESGVNARFVGNAMMDCFEINDLDFCIKDDSKVVGILPGSREEAYVNIKFILRIINKLEQLEFQKMDFLVAMASNLSIDRLKKVIYGTDWNIVESSSTEKNLGIYLKLISPCEKSVIRIIYHHFGDVLNKSDIFIGLAGTANEQAVGMGKPLISFPGEGSQFTEKFALAQRSLLGKSVSLIERDPQKIASKVKFVLNNKEVYNTMSRIGKKRMGKTGGIKAMVDIIIKYLNL